MKLSHEEFKYELLERLQQEVHPFHKVSHNQYTMRCPICGDSRRDKKKMRFYVKIDFNDIDEPVFYYCFNCISYGILNPSILKSLNISDIPTLSGLQAFNKRASKINNKYKEYSDKVNVRLAMVDELNPSNIAKKKYIEERLGIEISFEELLYFKTVFRLGDFLVDNGIEHVTVAPEKALDIHENYVGFLTTNNEVINARQVFADKSKGRRYEKYSLFKDRLGQLKFYTVPAEIDIMSSETITINMAEGVFDIMGIYFNVDAEVDKTNSLYIAICGAGYRSVIEYFIRQGFVCNVILNIYADTDQDLQIYRNLKKEYGAWFEQFNVYSNSIEKDFGVPANKIKIVKNKV